MKKIVTLILLSLFTIASFAQNTVTGSVKDAVTGEPLIGVGVIVSTGGGTVTDVDGSFSVNAGKDATLTFNLLGYADVVEPLNGRSKLEVFMKEDINFLDEVVVMGYTTQKKNELSSSPRSASAVPVPFRPAPTRSTWLTASPAVPSTRTTLKA